MKITPLPVEPGGLTGELRRRREAVVDGLVQALRNCGHTVEIHRVMAREAREPSDDIEDTLRVDDIELKISVYALTDSGTVRNKLVFKLSYEEAGVPSWDWRGVKFRDRLAEAKLGFNTTSLALRVRDAIAVIKRRLAQREAGAKLDDVAAAMTASANRSIDNHNAAGRIIVSASAARGDAPFRLEIDDLTRAQAKDVIVAAIAALIEKESTA